MYKKILVAGTFDGLHVGHQAVISRAFKEGEKVIIGITTDKFASLKGCHPFRLNCSNFEKRKEKIEEWLRENSYSNRAEIIEINDPFEPAASMTELEVLIVTSQNIQTGESINELRVKNNLPKLKLIKVPLIQADDAKPVSSTRIRLGEIYPNGKLVMPENMRLALAKPLGQLLSGEAIDGLYRKLASQPACRQAGAILRSRKIVITVGDVTTKTFLDHGVTPDLAIIDGMVGRKIFTKTQNQLENLPEKITKVKSGPGFISKEAIKSIKTTLDSLEPALPAGRSIQVSELKKDIRKSVAIIVDGEEDLLVLPAIIYAPLNSVVYYGQPARNASHSDAGGPKKGMVEVIVTQEKKQEALQLLQKFEK